MTDNWLQKLFIDEAKPALSRRSGSIVYVDPVIRELTVTKNGTYEAPEGVHGYSPLTVSVGEDRLNLFFTKQMTEVTETDLNGLTTISDNLFQDFTMLKSLDIPSSVTTIGYQSFMGCTSLESIYIPDSVVSIGQSAFHTCSSVTSIRLPKNVSIADYAFNGVVDILSLEIPAGVTIGRSCFHSCGIQTLTIAEGVTLGIYSFIYCKNLKKIVVTAKTPPTIQSDTFRDCTALESIEVPTGYSSVYKSATNWSAYADIIVEAT